MLLEVGPGARSFPVPQLLMSNMSAPVKEKNMAEAVQENITPLFRASCRDCDFCDGLRDIDGQAEGGALGTLRLEEEEDQDGFENVESTSKGMRGRQRKERRKYCSN